MPRYEFSDGNSNKFWQIELIGTSFTTTYGRIGATGQSTTKSFDSEEKAKREYDKLIAEKVKKGYSLVGDTNPVPLPTPPTSTANTASVPSKPKSKAERPVESVSADSDSKSSQLTQTQTKPGGVELILSWDDSIASLAAKERKALELVGVSKGEAAQLYKMIHGRFVKGGKTRLENGLFRAKRYKDLQNRVIWTYGNEKVPSQLNSEQEAAALLLLPAAIHGPSSAGGVHESLIEFWVAHSGLPFALEAFAATLAPVASEALWLLDGKDALWLADSPNRDIHDLLKNRSDRVLRRHLLGASREEQAEARAKAIELRQSGSLLVRSVLSSVFLEPEWIDADLKERAQTGESAIFTELALLHASSADRLTAYFSTMRLAEALFIAPSGDHSKKQITFSLALLDRFRESGIETLAQWLKRSAELASTDNWYSRQLLLGSIANLLDVLRCVSNSIDVAQAAVEILTRFSNEKISKNEDPRPAAIESLRRSPLIALPYVRDAVKKNGVWARELSPQLERLSGTAESSHREEAQPAELPKTLTVNRTFKAPSFWSPDAFTGPQTLAGKALPRAAVESLAALSRSYRSCAGSRDVI